MPWGELTVKLTKLQSPSLTWVPSKALGGSLATPFTWSYGFKKFAKLKHFNHIWLSIIEVCQAVNYYEYYVIFMDLVMFVVFVSFFKFVFLCFFLFLNNYSLSYLILYSFSQRGLQKLYKLQAPQNLDPPLIISLRSCDFGKNGCST